MSSVIIDLLGKSPIKPLQEHIEKTFECTQLLGEFLQASANNDWEQASALQARIVDAENQADEIKHMIRANLPKSVWMPLLGLSLSWTKDCFVHCSCNCLSFAISNRAMALTVSQTSFCPSSSCPILSLSAWFSVCICSSNDCYC